jgi:hypothetical protein
VSCTKCLCRSDDVRRPDGVAEGLPRARELLDQGTMNANDVRSATGCPTGSALPLWSARG